MQKYTFSVGGHTMAPTRAYLRIPVEQANLAKRNSHFIEIIRFICLHNPFAFSRYHEDKEEKRGKRKEKKKKEYIERKSIIRNERKNRSAHE